MQPAHRNFCQMPGPRCTGHRTQPATKEAPSTSPSGSLHAPNAGAAGAARPGSEAHPQAGALTWSPD